MCRQTVPELVREILQAEGWGQKKLADKIGVTQPAVARWLKGLVKPRRHHLSKLHKLHAQARAHRWSSNSFVPICAWAESYPAELSKLATRALDKMLGADPLIGPPDGVPYTASPDIRIRPAKLPDFVHAYTFVNDKIAPSVFVILYRKNLSLADRHEAVFKELYAHVREYLFKGDDIHTPAPISFSKKVIRHYHPKEDNDDEGTEDQG